MWRKRMVYLANIHWLVCDFYYQCNLIDGEAYPDMPEFVQNLHGSSQTFRQI